MPCTLGPMSASWHSSTGSSVPWTRRGRVLQPLLQQQLRNPAFGDNISPPCLKIVSILWKRSVRVIIWFWLSRQCSGGSVQRVWKKRQDSVVWLQHSWETQAEWQPRAGQQGGLHWGWGGLGVQVPAAPSQGCEAAEWDDLWGGSCDPPWPQPEAAPCGHCQPHVELCPPGSPPCQVTVDTTLQAHTQPVFI